MSTLEVQVERMLNSPKKELAMNDFFTQWMELDRFDQIALPSNLRGQFNESVKEEPLKFFNYLINNNLPVENLIGEEGQGFYYLMGGLQLERLAGATAACAACEYALEYSLQYMAEREAFGRTLNKFQVLRHRVAQLASEIEATKYFVYHCCRLHSDGHYAVKECSMAKLLATELSDKTMYQCLQFFGGYGYMQDYGVERLMRDAKITQIYEGTTEIQKMVIARELLEN